MFDVSSESDAVDAVQAAEQTEFVMRQLAELPERERVVIHAFFLQDRDAKQTGEMLGLSRSGVYALLGRAVAKLSILVDRCELKREAT